MRLSKIMLMTFPVMLAGCLNSDDDSPTPYSHAPAPVPVQVAPANPSANPPAPPADCGCPGAGGAPQPCSNPAVCVNPPAQDWHPTEGHLVKAGELVMELQRRNGGVKPSHAAMVAHLQANMQAPFAVTAPQAERVLEEMGL
jgi:hypothetical protein